MQNKTGLIIKRGSYQYKKVPHLRDAALSQNYQNNVFNTNYYINTIMSLFCSELPTRVLSDIRVHINH